MHRNKLLYFILILIGTSCIEKYTPDIDSDEGELYVITGRVTDHEGFQEVMVQKSSSVNNPSKVPVDGCLVIISDDLGNTFSSGENIEGRYQVFIEQEYLTYGSAYRVEVITPEGELISSTFDTLTYCPPIDTLFYRVVDVYKKNMDDYIPAVQFYTNYDGNDSPSIFIRYEFEETYKYYSDYPKQWTWNGRRLTEYDPPDWSERVCWKTLNEDKIYTLTTRLLENNRYDNYPLHHIEYTSPKLANGYSLLVRQLSLTEEAFEYYQKINDNIIDKGGLYETQPQQIQGNLINETNPDKRVLGFFSASGVSEIREYYSEFEGIDLNTFDICSPVALDMGYVILRPLSEPVYIWFENGTFMLPKECVECTSLGGSLSAPDFWPEDQIE